MAINLTAMRDILSPGVWAMVHADDELPLVMPAQFPHLRSLRASGRIKIIRDIMDLPPSFTRGDGQRYEATMVFAGRDYPQGWGRGPGGAAAEPPPEPDGKVDTFKMERNQLRIELDEEIGAYFEYREKGGK